MARDAERAQACSPEGPTECWALTEEAARQWLATARVGERTVYARGPRLLRNAGVEYLSKLSERGHVRLNFNRDLDGRGQYVATRLAPPAERPVARAAACRPEPCERDEAQRVMAVLRRHANLGRPCPTNSDIMAQADLKSPQQASYQISKLIAAKLVRVETTVDGQRVVTIVGTGKRTARSAAR